MRVGPLVVSILVCVATACGGDDGGAGGPACDPACPIGQACQAGACVAAPPCTTADDCDPGEICSGGGVCIPDGTCVDDRDCADADFCSATSTCIPDGTCATNDDCLAGMICNPSHACVPGSECGGQELTIDPVPPNMLIVLDRSCSMTDAVMGTPKWTSAVAAVNQLTTAFAGDVRWGLTLFPDTTTPNCGQSAIPVPVGPTNEQPIRTLLTASLMTNNVNYPDGPCVTNIDTAMQQAATETALDDPLRRSFVMLITDGMQSGCSLAGGDAGTATIITNLRTMRQVNTFVVGFGGGEDQAQMNTFADAGGMPLVGNPRYYRATNAAELQMQLAQIAGLVIGCDFTVANPPANIDDIYVFFEDTQQIPRDQTHAGGWDYDPVTMTLTIYGAACDQLRSGTVDDVDVVFGCPVPVPG